MASLPELYLRFTFDLVARETFEHLHWGYFRGLAKEPGNLSAAQQAFADLLVGLVPEGARTVMDVGCGLGGIARMLAAQGRRVTAVSPRADHCARLERARMPGIEVRCARFEELSATGDHDLLLFAESLNFFVRQDPERAEASVAAFAERCAAQLAPNGGLLLADLVSEPLARAVERTPGFAVRQCLDVTDDVAYTAEALQDRVERSVRPYHALLLAVLEHHDPALRAAVDRALSNVDNVPLRALFQEGRMIELDLLRERRYLVWRLERV